MPQRHLLICLLLTLKTSFQLGKDVEIYTDSNYILQGLEDCQQCIKPFHSSTQFFSAMKRHSLLNYLLNLYVYEA